MKSINIIYWSGTGNTQSMAEAVCEGAIAAGAKATLFEVSQISAAEALKADAIALGCPSMGVEVLEESEMEPFVLELESLGVAGKPMALFGSYDWGDGQWMREWIERMEGAGANLVTDGLTVQNTPDAAGLTLCKDLGKKLAGE